MLPYILALVIGIGSFAFYMAAFFFPEVHRKNDFIWSGVGLFYALILWVCGGRIVGAVLLGQMASVSLLGWLGWQTLTMRRELTAPEQRTEVSPEILEKIKNFSIGGLLQPLLQSVKSISGKKQVKTTPKATATVTATVPPTAPGVAEERNLDLELGINPVMTAELVEEPQSIPASPDTTEITEASVAVITPIDKDAGTTPTDTTEITEASVAVITPIDEDAGITPVDTAKVTEEPETLPTPIDAKPAKAKEPIDELTEESDWDLAAEPPAAKLVPEKPESNLSPVEEKSSPIKQVSSLFKNLFSKKRSPETDLTSTTTKSEILREEAIALTDRVSTIEEVAEFTPSPVSSPAEESSEIFDEATSVDAATAKVTETPEISAVPESFPETNVMAQEVRSQSSVTEPVTETPPPPAPPAISWETSVMADETTPVDSPTEVVTETPAPLAVPEPDLVESGIKVQADEAIAPEITETIDPTPELTSPQAAIDLTTAASEMGMNEDVTQPSSMGMNEDVTQPSSMGMNEDITQPSPMGMTENVTQPSPMGMNEDVTQPEVTESTTDSEPPAVAPEVEDSTPSESPKVILRNFPNSKLLELLKKSTPSGPSDSSKETNPPSQDVTLDSDKAY